MSKDLYTMLDVSATMLITLYARARESVSKNPIIKDLKAVEMIETIKREVTNSNNPIHKKIVNDSYNPKLSVTMALRSRRFDKYVTDFLTKNPQGTVINMGCGLDTRFDRIDNGKVKWFDIDFPEVIELRSRFMQENNRRKFISMSILEKSWINIVKTGGPYLILAEGVFMYLTEVAVKNLMSFLKKELNKYELVCELTNIYWVNKMKSPYMRWKFKNQLGMSNSMTFTFGVPDSQYFENWDIHYHFIDEWTYFDDSEKKLGWFNLFSSIKILRKIQWTAYYRIDEEIN